MKTSFLIISALLSATLTFGQRKVLIEQFTNSGCPPCAANTPFIANYVASDTNSILLCYHTSFPYLDSMYYENAAQSNQRVSYYSVSGVPTARVDGNFFSGNLLPVLSTTISARSATAPKYDVEINTNSLINNTIQVSATLTSLDATNSGENLVAMAVITEKSVLKSSYLASPGANSEQEYPWVVRRMLPNEFGTTLVNKSLNGIDYLSQSWPINSIKNTNELYVVIFVQNVDTKEIYQTAISKINNTIGINDLSSKINLFEVNPTIFTSEIKIQLLSKSNSKITITNILGRKVDEFELSNESNTFSRQLIHLQSGIYLITCEAENKKQVLRLVKE